MFDKHSRPRTEESLSSAPQVGPEDERIALRCNRRELQLVDSFVSTGEFRSRSELVRHALRDFLRARARAALPPGNPGADPRGLLEVRVRLRQDEVDTLREYGELAANGQALEDLLAQLIRHGEMELRVAEVVERSRAAVRGAVEARGRLEELGRSGRELERRGVVGR